MSFIFACAFASAALDGAIHPLLEAFMKPLVKAAGSFMLDEAGRNATGGITDAGSNQESKDCDLGDSSGEGEGS